MRRFTRLYLDLDATGSTTEKIDLLAAYFAGAPERDAAWALALLTGNRPKRAASTRALRALALAAAGIPAWLFEECYAAVGDLSETIALLLPDDVADGSADEPLHVTMEQRVLPLIDLGDAGRAEVIADAWKAMDAEQRFVYHKLIRGGFRIGVQKRLVARALAQGTGVDVTTMAQRLVATIEPTVEAYRRVIAGERAGERALVPMPFYLASPLDRAPEDLGPVGNWHAEWKYDGIRAQVVRRGGDVALWSRGEELITHQFPEIVDAAARLTVDAVLDGEVLLWRGDAPRPFAELQPRLNRKTAPSPQLGLFETERVVLVAFDLLERDGEDLRTHSQAARRAALEELLEPVGDEDTIRMSPLVDAASWAALAEHRETSRARGVEGLMLKHREAPYGVGRARSERGWWKWKVDPYAVDAVLVAAQPGTGRRASLYTDYTFALWGRDDDDERLLVTFAKAYSGLTQDDIETLDRWIRAHTTRRAGPFRQVEPEQVFEIAFEDVRVSKRHKSGIAVRFPRIARWRRDKSAGEADSVDSVKALIAGEAT